jgi:hypothetical protein
MGVLDYMNELYANLGVGVLDYMWRSVLDYMWIKSAKRGIQRGDLPGATRLIPLVSGEPLRICGVGAYPSPIALSPLGEREREA